MMIIHIWGKNKPTSRGFKADGSYYEVRSASYSCHRIAHSMQEAQKIIQELLFQRNWEVQIEVEA